MMIIMIISINFNQPLILCQTWSQQNLFSNIFVKPYHFEILRLLSELYFYCVFGTYLFVIVTFSCHLIIGTCQLTPLKLRKCINLFSICTTLEIILLLCLRKTRISNCFPSTLKRKVGLLKFFLPFRRAPFSCRIHAHIQSIVCWQ